MKFSNWLRFTFINDLIGCCLGDNVTVGTKLQAALAKMAPVIMGMGIRLKRNS